MGLSFKENCSDHRNTRVIDLIKSFKSFNCNVDVYDPWVIKEEALEEYNIELINKPKTDNYDAILLSVAHQEFKQLSLEQINIFGKKNYVLYDIKYLLDADAVDGRL